MNPHLSALAEDGFMPLMIVGKQGGGEMLRHLYIWSAQDGKPVEHYVSRVTLVRFDVSAEEHVWLLESMYREVVSYIAEHGLVGAAVPGALDAATLEEARQWWARTARFHNRKAGSRLLY